MTELNIDNIKAQMRKGILEYCILSIISRNDAYASSIIAELKAAEMIVVEGTLYPLLTRQKTRGFFRTAGKNRRKDRPANIIRSRRKAENASNNSTSHGVN